MDSTPQAHTTEQDATTQDCAHGEPVKWNPFNHVVQCHRCGQVFVPGEAATPADAVFAFAAWLSSRSKRTVLSRTDDAAPAAELAGQFCQFQGWEVGPNYPHTFRMPPDGGLHPIE